MNHQDSASGISRRSSFISNFDPRPHIKRWDVMFVASCVFAVSVDPLFLYVPVINEDYKCLWLDKRLEIVAICLRAITDMIYVANIFVQYLSDCKDRAAPVNGQTGEASGAHGAASEPGRTEKATIVPTATPEHGQTEEASNTPRTAKRYSWLDLVIDILAILPLPQVLIPIIFSRRKGSNLLSIKRFLDAIILFQYMPRVLRIFLSWRKLLGSNDKFTLRTKASLTFSLYILSSYVLGAFWYLFSIERETTCWSRACKTHAGCTPSSFKCGHGSGNHTFLQQYCSVGVQETTKKAFFDFGIFSEALRSGIVSSTDIPQKILYSFWWGHRSLSSLGQNLETSTNFWENSFAVLISILGLLLALCFIENLKNYIQLMSKESKNRRTERPQDSETERPQDNETERLEKIVLEKLSEIRTEIDKLKPKV